MKCFLTSFLVLLFSISFAFSQTSDTDLSVTVKNQLGELVPDAELTLLRNGKSVGKTTTNKSGVARFGKIEAGEYQIAVAAVGFNPYLSEVLTVKKGEPQTIQASLEVLTVETQVAVGGDEDVDTEKFGATKIISEDDIKKLPDNAEDLEKALRALAGETATGEQMPITVDGQTGARIPPKEAIKQIRVNQNVFSAQHEGPTGGGIEIFTQSGVKKFTGGGSFNFGDSRINATDAFLGKRLPSQTKTYNFNFGGPLGKKGSFFLYAGYGQNDSSVAINAKTLDASLRPVVFQETVLTPTRDYNVFLTSSYDLTKKHKISLNYSFSNSNAKNQNVGGFLLASKANNAKNNFQWLGISETFLINENTVLQSRLNFNYSDANSFGGNNSPAINVLESFFGGGSQNDRRNRFLRFQGGNDASWQHKKYGLNVGWQVRGNYIWQNSTANFGGTYTFAGRTAPVLDANNQPISDPNGNVVTTQIDSLESYRRTLLFRGLGFTPTQIRNLGGGANQFTISGGDSQVSVNQYDAAFYVQNSYKISDTLAASFGVRYENQSNIDSHYNFSPRFGLIWSPKGNAKSKNLWLAPPRISLGYGLFYRRFDVNNFVAVEQTSGEKFQYLVTDSTVLDAFPNSLSLNDLRQFALPRNRRFIADDLESPMQNTFSVTATKKLPLEFTGNFTFTYSKTARQSLTRNINAPLAGTFNPLNPSIAVRPLGNIGNVYETFSGGRGENMRIAFGIQIPQKIGWGNVNYSFVKSKSDSTFGSGSPFDPYDFSQEYAPDISDGVHRVSGYFYYDKLPYNFSIDGNFDISSGRRFNIFTGRDTNGDGYFFERPSFAANLTKSGLIETPYGILDPNPAPGDKLVPRNLGRGERNFTFDLGFGKAIKFGEDKANKKPAKQSLNFSVRINNAFNIVNRSTPIGNMSSPNFLKVLSNASSDSFVIINGVRGGANNRSFIFGVRFSFL